MISSWIVVPRKVVAARAPFAAAKYTFTPPTIRTACGVKRKRHSQQAAAAVTRLQPQQHSMGVEQELIKLSEELLQSISDRDWAKYSDLCDETLTAFEPEAGETAEAHQSVTSQCCLTELGWRRLTKPVA